MIEFELLPSFPRRFQESRCLFFAFQLRKSGVEASEMRESVVKSDRKDLKPEILIWKEKIEAREELTNNMRNNLVSDAIKC